MSSTLSDDVIGNDVVDTHGDRVGVVTAVEYGTPLVDPDPGLTDKLKARLGWEDASDEDFPLQEAAIDTVTDDEIRLRYER